MNTLASLFPAKDSASSETPAPRHATAKSSEPFAALMNRALAKPAQEKDHNAFPLKKTSPDSRSGRVSKPEAGKPKTSAESPSSPADNSLSSPNTDPSAHESAKEKNPQDPASDATPDTATTATGDASSETLTVVAAQMLATTAAAPVIAPATSAVKSTGKAAAGATADGKLGEVAGVTAGTPAESVAGNRKALAEKISALGGKKPAGDGKESPASAPDPAKNADSEGGAIRQESEVSSQESEVCPLSSVLCPLVSEKPPSTTPEINGIPAAQQTATMNNADQANKIAGEPEQNLPGVTVLAAGESGAEARGQRSEVRGQRPEASPLPSALETHNSVSSPADRVPAPADVSTSDLISASSQTDLRLRALERTHDIVALHAMHLKDSGNDSLRVVIKPGAGLQLSLELKQNGGHLEAQAVLQRGDFKQLNQHWAELQQRLEERGIRLAPLSGSENSTAGNEHFQRQPSPSAEQDALTTGAFAEFALAGSVTGSSAQRVTRTAAYRGWESWA